MEGDLAKIVIYKRHVGIVVVAERSENRFSDEYFFKAAVLNTEHMLGLR